MDTYGELCRLASQAASGDLAGARLGYLQAAVVMLDKSIELVATKDPGALGSLEQELRLARAALVSAKSLEYPIVFSGSSQNGAETRNEAVPLEDQNLTNSTSNHSGPHVRGFVHVAMVGNWRNILEELLDRIRDSGLHRRAAQIVLSFSGDSALIPPYVDGKYHVIHAAADNDLREGPTLKQLQAWCRGHEGYVFFMHTKGAEETAESVQEWRRYMTHFVVDRYEECLRALTNRDAVGVNWQWTPWPHFSGNFWWAKAAYVRTLPEVGEIEQEPTRPLPWEKWIGMNPDAQVASLHNSLVNHYVSSYGSQEYGHIDNGQQVVPCISREMQHQAEQLRDVLKAQLSDVWPVTMVVSLGIGSGFSLSAWASVLPAARIVGVDLYGSSSCGAGHAMPKLGPSPERWQRRAVPGHRNALSILSTSQEFAQEFSYPIDILQMDCVEKYDEIAADFIRWEPKVRPGGCILFHNTLRFPQDSGRFFASLTGEKEHLADGHGLGIWRKPQQSCAALFTQSLTCSPTVERECLLSVLIPTLPARRKSLGRLLTKLDHQRTQFGLHSEVEILILEDNKELTVGEKRNLLMGRSTGRFIVFIDDDDDIDNHYLGIICTVIRQYPQIDCIGFTGEFHRDGMPAEPTIYSLHYQEPQNRGDAPGCRIYLRPPQHVSPIRREAAIQFTFPDVSWGEDVARAASLARSGILEREFFFGACPMYHYHFSSRNSETCPASIGVS